MATIIHKDIPPGTEVADNLRQREQQEATAAVEHLDRARELMGGVRDQGGKRDDVMKKAADAYAEANKGLQKIAEVHKLRQAQVR